MIVLKSWPKGRLFYYSAKSKTVKNADKLSVFFTIYIPKNMSFSSNLLLYNNFIYWLGTCICIFQESYTEREHIMPKIIQYTLATLVALFFTTISASATVITFDGMGVNTDKPVIVDGFTFDYLNENGWCICNTGYSSGQISNGTDQILIRDMNDRDSTISMTIDGVAEFSLTSFLGADGLLGIGGRTIEVTGFYGIGGSVVETFSTIADTQSLYLLSGAFTGLTAVNFYSFGDEGDGLALDNITVNEDVRLPEPAPLALLGLGLMGLGLARKRRS